MKDYFKFIGGLALIALTILIFWLSRTAIIEPNVITSPSKLSAAAVSVQCPGDVDPKSVKDAKETSVVGQRD